MEQDKINAYMTLYTVLTRFIKLAAPMIPFVTETIYQNLVRSIDKDAPESIHFCDYPVSKEEFIDKDIEENMNIVLNTVVIGRACRNTSGIKTRQPLGKMFVSSDKKLDEFYAEIIKDELNVKEVVWQTDVSEYTMYSFKPQLKTLGPKFGKLIGGIKKALETVDSAKATEELKANNTVTVNVNGEDITIAAEDLLITMIHKEGFAAANGNVFPELKRISFFPQIKKELFFSPRFSDCFINICFYHAVITRLSLLFCLPLGIMFSFSLFWLLHNR